MHDHNPFAGLVARAAFLGLFLLSTVTPASSQTVANGPTTQTRAVLPRYELFAGYSYLPDLDEYRASRAGGHGWSVALAVNLHKYWGLVVDADGQTWTSRGELAPAGFSSLTCPRVAGCSLRGDEQIRLTYLSFGPRVQLRNGRFVAFALGAVEAQRSHYSELDLAYVGRADDLAFIAFYSTRPQAYGSNRRYIFDMWDGPLERHGDNVVARARLAEKSSAAWGFGFGGGADLTLTERIGVRLVQINYSLGGFGEGPGRKLRVKTGVVFRFG